MLASLLYRRRTGRGVYVDLSQLDSSVSLIGDAILGYQMNDRNPDRRGNRHPYMAPHGIYRCRGEEEEWVAIAVASDAEWQRLCAAIGKPGLADDERFADVLSRWRRQDELDAVLSEWTRDKDSNDVMQTLQAVGIAATPVESAEMIFDEPALPGARAHGAGGPSLDRPRSSCPALAGRCRKPPAACAGRPPGSASTTRPSSASCWASDDAELSDLEAEGVIGKVPTRDNIALDAMTTQNETTVAECVEQALAFLAQSEAEFEAGDTRQGAEKLYGAACQVVMAAAKQRGWAFRSHRDNKNTTTRLAGRVWRSVPVGRVLCCREVSHSLLPRRHGGLRYRGRPTCRQRIRAAHGRPRRAIRRQRHPA